MTIYDRMLSGVSFRVLRAAGDEGGGGGGGDDGGGAGDAGGEGDGGAAAAAAAAAGGEGDGQGEQPKKQDWRDKELARKHRKLQEEQSARQRAEEENARLRQQLAERAAAAADTGGGGGGNDDGGDPPRRQEFRTQAEFDRAVEEAAERKAAKRLQDDQQARAASDMERATMTATQNGNKTFGEQAFGEAIDRLKVLGGFPDANDFAIIMGTDEPERVLFELGSKPDEYHRIMELPAHKRAAEFVKLSLPKANAKPISGAPDPVRPVRGGAPVNDPNELKDELDDGEWYQRRAKQKRAKWLAQSGRAAV